MRILYWVSASLLILLHFAAGSDTGDRHKRARTIMAHINQASVDSQESTVNFLPVLLLPYLVLESDVFQTGAKDADSFCGTRDLFSESRLGFYADDFIGLGWTEETVYCALSLREIEVGSGAGNDCEFFWPKYIIGVRQVCFNNSEQSEFMHQAAVELIYDMASAVPETTSFNEINSHGSSECFEQMLVCQIMNLERLLEIGLRRFEWDCDMVMVLDNCNYAYDCDGHLPSPEFVEYMKENALYVRACKHKERQENHMVFVEIRTPEVKGVSKGATQYTGSLKEKEMRVISFMKDIKKSFVAHRGLSSFAKPKTIHSSQQGSMIYYFDWDTVWYYVKHCVWVCVGIGLCGYVIRAKFI